MKDINDSGQHLLALINEILDLAKVEAGRMELVRSNAHVPIIVEACCTLVSERFQRKRQVLDAVVEPSVSFWFLDHNSESPPQTPPEMSAVLAAGLNPN